MQPETIKPQIRSRLAQSAPAVRIARKWKGNRSGFGQLPFTERLQRSTTRSWLLVALGWRPQIHLTVFTGQDL